MRFVVGRGNQWADDPISCSRKVTERLEGIVSARDETLYP